MPRERIYSAGERIGPYKVVRRLALGAASVVYEAEPDPGLRGDLLARGAARVAVKAARFETLPGDRYERRALLERMEREFETLFGLTQLRGHSYVVGVYDFGMEDGLPYYAMELVEGTTLEKALEARPRIGQMVNVFGKLCAAAAYLHNLGIVHRDIKPSNVMLRYDGGAPVLIDFGVCLPPFGRRLTSPHDLLGTPEYVSPEQAAYWLKGKEARPYLAAPTDDVWALGLVLYEILTGGLPWRTPAERREALMREILKRKLPHVCKVNPEVPKELGDAAMRLLERSLRKRPKDASEALMLLGKAGEAIGEVLTRIPERRPPEWGLGEVLPGDARTPRGHVLAVQLSALSLLLVAGVGGLAAMKGRAAAPAESQITRGGAAQPNLSADTSTNPGTNTLENGPLPDAVVSSDTGDEEPFENGPVGRGRALPKHPYRGQMLAPCPAPYVEMIGACWKKVRVVRVDGTTAPCLEDMFEVSGKDGPECYVVVAAPVPNTSKSARDGGVE